LFPRWTLSRNKWTHVSSTIGARRYSLSRRITGYDGKTVAEDIHQLVTKLGFKTIFLVGHDFGAQIAYSYAAHPTEVKRLVVMAMNIPDFTCIAAVRGACTTILAYSNISAVSTTVVDSYAWPNHSECLPEKG
jgi:pimeloyl-ACP methyl ester carboxylesterase